MYFFIDQSINYFYIFIAQKMVKLICFFGSQRAATPAEIFHTIFFSFFILLLVKLFLKKCFLVYGHKKPQNEKYLIGGEP